MDTSPTIWAREGFYLGLLPFIFQPDDPRDFITQANDRYSHGGGWLEFEGFTFHWDSFPGAVTLEYPGDPALPEIGRLSIPARQTTIHLFHHSWVAIYNHATKAVNIARMD